MFNRTATTKALASLGYFEAYRTVTDREDGGVLLRYEISGLTFEAVIAPDGAIEASIRGGGVKISADPIYPPEGE